MNKIPEQSRFFYNERGTSGLNRDSIKGGAVLILAQTIRIGIQLVSLPIMSRLLSPSDFGIFAMVVPISAFGQMIADFGLSTAAIQTPKLRPQQSSNLFWINLLVGSILTTMLLFASPIISNFYNQPTLVPIVVALSSNLILVTASVQHCALLRRGMMFRSLAVLQVSSGVLSFVGGILSAYLGFGHWALVHQVLIASTATLFGSVLLTRWCPSLPRRDAETWPLLTFGSGLLGVRLGDFARLHIDKVLLGKFAGEFAVGQYTRASQLLTIPLTQIFPPISSVLLPLLSRVNGDERAYRAIFLPFFATVAMLTVPLGIFMTIFGDVFTELLLGDGWGQAGDILRYLAPLGMVQSLTSSLTILMVSQGQSRELFLQSMRNNCLAVVAIACAVPWGSEAMAIAYSASGILLRAPTWFWYASRKGAIRLDDLLRALIRPTQVAIVCLVFLVIIKIYTHTDIRFIAMGGSLALVLGVIAVGMIFSEEYRRFTSKIFMHLLSRKTTQGSAANRANSP